MDTDSPAYRFYAERLIRHIVAHYRDNPAVIGWQLDNETNSYGAANPDVFIGFQHYLEKKFVTPEALSKAWFLNYWGENLHTWEDLPTRDGAQSTGYKLEWTRWSQMRVTDFLHWQAALVRECASPRQFVTTDYGGMMQPRRQRRGRRRGPRHTGRQRLPRDTGSLRRLRAVLAGGLHPLPEALQLPGHRDQRPDHRLDLFATSTRPTTANSAQDVYTHLSNGANMVEYWHWASIAANQETYWKGVLSHDLEPNRAYAEVSRTAHELEKIGPHLVGLQIHNQVAILWSRDSFNAIDFMPFARRWSWQHWLRLAGPADPQVPLRPEYQLRLRLSHHQGLLRLQAAHCPRPLHRGRRAPAAHIGLCEERRPRRHDLQERIRQRELRRPLGSRSRPLREAAGFSYQEFSNLEHPLALRGDPFHVGAENGRQRGVVLGRVPAPRARQGDRLL